MNTKSALKMKKKTVQMNDEQTLVFIDQIFRHKTIWDRKDKDYKNIVTKADMWNEIAEVMQQPVQVLKDKWTSLQATYRKYRSNYNRSFITGSGTDEIALPTWFGYSAMRFLDSTTECGATVNTMSHLEIEVLNEDDVPHPETVRDRSPIPGPSRTTTMDDDSIPNQQTEAPRPSTPTRNSRRQMHQGSIAYTEEALEALKTVGTATIELINKMSSPSDELDGVREAINQWTPERRQRFLVRIRRFLADEEDDRFFQRFGYHP